MGTINSIVEVLQFGFFLGMIYVVKEIFDSQQFLDKNPYFKERPVRLLFVLIACSSITSILQPQYEQIAYTTFFLSLTVTFILVTTLYKSHITKVDLQFTVEGADYAGVEVSLSIPSDHYKELSPGVLVKRLMSVKDIGPEEEEYRSFLEKLNYIGKVILLVKFVKGGAFPCHIHPFDEMLAVLRGAVNVTNDPDGNPMTTNTGETTMVRAGVKHFFEATEDGFGVVVQSIV